MKLRTIALLTTAVALLGGCVVSPHAHPPRSYHYDSYYYYDDYRTTPSYEGYYYVRIIFISNAPYYVDDDRHIRPIPPHLHDHFRRYQYREQLRYGPAFSRDSEVRNGYPISRIIYWGDVPYFVDDGRVARPLPDDLHEHFRYTPSSYSGSRTTTPILVPTPKQPPAYGREREHQEPPAFGQERERQEPPAYGRERERQEPPAFGRERERQEPPANNREREPQETPANNREHEPQGAPANNREREPQEAPANNRERERQEAPANSGRQRERQTSPAAPQSSGERAPEAQRQGNGRSTGKKKSGNASDEDDASKKRGRNKN